MRALARLVRASAGLALTCLGSRAGALQPLPHRFLFLAMIGGGATTEFLRGAPDEVVFIRGAAAADNDDSACIIAGLDDFVDALSPHVEDGDATMQSRRGPDPDGEDDDDDDRSRCSGADSGRDDDDDDDDDDDNDDDDDAVLRSPLLDPPLRGGEAPGTAAPALGSR